MKALLALLLLATVAHAETLTNGMRVIIAPDPTVNSIVVFVRYHGGFAEDANTVVLDQLFTDAAHDARLDAIGGYAVSNFEAHHMDVFEVVPAGALELALWAEADRMAHLADRIDASRLKTAKTAALADYHAAYEASDAYARADLEIDQALWRGRGHRGGQPRRIEAVTVDEMKALARARLAPANATLVIAGRVDQHAALAMVRRYFYPVAPGRRAMLAKDVPGERSEVTRHVAAFRVADKLALALVIEQLVADDISVDVRANEELRLSSSEQERELIPMRLVAEVNTETVDVARSAAATKLLLKLESLPHRARQLAAGTDIDALRQQIRGVTREEVLEFLVDGIK